MIMAVLGLAAFAMATAILGWRLLAEIHDFETFSEREVGDPEDLWHDWPHGDDWPTDQPPKVA